VSPQQYPLVPVQFLVPVPLFTQLNLLFLDHLFPASLRILGVLAFGKREYVEWIHLFRLNNHGEGDKAIRACPVFPS